MENKTGPEPESIPKDLQPLFTLIAGEGDGFLLGVAAGDTAGSAWDLGYSAVTEQVTVIAYDLITHRSIDPDRLREALLELAGLDGEDPVYRAETPEFKSWIERTRSGQAVPSETPHIEGAPRATPLGVAFRKEPAAVLEQTLELARVFDRHAVSIASYLVGATATAASCFAQSGRDLIAGVAEALGPTFAGLGDAPGGDAVRGLERRITGLIPSVGITDGEEALAAVGGREPIDLLLAGLLLAAPVNDRFHAAVEQSARIGGSNLGAFAGAIVGARLGIKGWPWAFANDTWFAEIGRRLVRGPDEVADLPIPYAVEHHLMYGPGRGFR